jgi:hypothetical protein
MDILGTLGLDSVSANPDDVPTGSYDAVIYQSEFVLSKNKDTIAHVITFKVEGGDNDGAKPSQWNTLGKTPRNEAGEFPAKVEDVTQYEPTMSKKQESYYKKTWVDSGVPEDQVGKLPPEALVGKPVTIRVYMSNGYKNVAVNGVRVVDSASPQGPSNAGGETPFHAF